MTLNDRELKVGEDGVEVICPRCGRPGVMRIHRGHPGQAILVVAHHGPGHPLAGRLCWSRNINTGYKIICPLCGQEGELKFGVIADGGDREAHAWVRHADGAEHPIVRRRCR